LTNTVLLVNLTYILDGFTTWCFDHCFVDFQKILLENDLLLSEFGEIKMYKNILLPLDCSKLAEESLSTAVNLAKIFGSKISLIHSAETFSLLKDDRETESKILKHQLEKYLNQIKDDIENQGIATNVVLKIGQSVNHGLEICDYARHSDVDLIIMSTHSAGGIASWAIGSVSDKVIRHSPKPVLLLRASTLSPLSDKAILLVDDEPDILDTVEEELEMCQIYKASDYDTAKRYLESQAFDIVVLDIMGVRGFDLLKESVSRGFPTIMFTAHALTPEALERSMELGAVSFLPKEKITEIVSFLEDVIGGGGRPVWKRLFHRLGYYFESVFGKSQKEKEFLLKKFEEVFRESAE